MMTKAGKGGGKNCLLFFFHGPGHKKNPVTCHYGVFYKCSNQPLQLYNILGSQSFLSFNDIKADPRSLLQRPKAFGLDCRVMNKDIRTAVLL